MRIVDVDEPGTWPEPVSQRVGVWAERLRGTTDYTCDLGFPIEAEDSFRSLFASHLVQVYHCTRLLEHEVALVRQQGLRPLSAQLIEDRIHGAWNHGAITARERDTLLENHVFAVGDHRYREGKVCLIISRRPLDEQADGCWPLLTTWGGEGIYMSTVEAVALRPRLSELGRPAVVVALVDISVSWRTNLSAPAIGRIFVGRALDLADYGGELHHHGGVPPGQILDVWQPGDSEYEKHPDLPSE